MKKIKKIKWELGTALFLSVASIVLAVVWIISLIQGITDTDGWMIANAVIWTLQSVLWPMKAKKDYKRLKELKEKLNKIS